MVDEAPYTAFASIVTLVAVIIATFCYIRRPREHVADANTSRSVRERRQALLEKLEQSRNDSSAGLPQQIPVPVHGISGEYGSDNITEEVQQQVDTSKEQQIPMPADSSELEISQSHGVLATGQFEMETARESGSSDVCEHIEKNIVETKDETVVELDDDISMNDNSQNSQDASIKVGCQGLIHGKRSLFWIDDLEANTPISEVQSRLLEFPLMQEWKTHATSRLRLFFHGREIMDPEKELNLLGVRQGSVLMFLISHQRCNKSLVQKLIPKAEVVDESYESDDSDLFSPPRPKAVANASQAATRMCTSSSSSLPQPVHHLGNGSGSPATEVFATQLNPAALSGDEDEDEDDDWIYH